MFFDDPQNRLLVARTHQRELVETEQRDRLARQAQPDRSGPDGSGLGSWWQSWRAAAFWLWARLPRHAAAPVREIPHLPE